MKRDADLSLENGSSSFLSKLLHFALRRDCDTPWLHFAFAIFSLFTLFMAFDHVPWGDEAQPWLFSRDLNLWGLFIEARHNGHPILWFLCLKALQAAGADYLGMMVLNWIFIVVGIWLLFYRSTLPLAARIAVAFAPVCVLEVAFTARDYAIAAPLLFLAAIFYKKVEVKPLRYSFVLALLASTNVFAFAVFIGISFQFLLEQAFTFGRKAFSLRPLYIKYLGANLVLLVGALFLVAQLAPIRFSGDTLPTSVSLLIPSVTHILDPYIIIVFLTPLALVFFEKNPIYPRVLGGILITFIAAIPTITYGCTSRHEFMIALGVVYFCWIYLDAFISGGTYFSRRYGPVGIKVLVTLLIILACVASKPGGIRQLLRRPFDSRNAAQAVVQNGLDRPDTLLVTIDPFRAAPLLLFFKHIRTYYVPAQFGPSPQAFAQDAYIGFRNNMPTLTGIKPLVLDVAKQNPSKTILVVSMGSKGNVGFPINDPDYHLVSIYQTPLTPNYGVDSESYQVYVFKPKQSMP